MKRINEILLERKVDAQYVTLLLMYWNTKTRALTVSNAGGLTPMICRNGERLRVLAEGIPLGLLDDREYDEVVFPTQSGDLILLASDGVPDQQDAGEVEYGMHRLFSVLRKNCAAPVDAIPEAILADIDEFRGEMPLTDDQTLIAIRVQ